MKILLAEDDAITREIISDNLEQWGYDVVSVDNGLTAWTLLQQEDAPKLILLDWQMPGMSGLELCKKLRARQTGSYVYVVMLTSLSDKVNVVQGLEAGADDYLTKPCNPYELKVRLQTGQRVLSMESELLAALEQIKRYEQSGAGSKNVYDSNLIERELEILRLAVAGKSNEEIASNFHLSPDWVMAHLNNIMSKMAVSTREAMIAKAMKDGFLNSPVR